MVDWNDGVKASRSTGTRDLEERLLLPSVRASSDQVAAPTSNGALEHVWLRQPGGALLAFAVVTLLTACARTESKQDDQIYKAYGDTWVYSKTAITTRYLTLRRVACSAYATGIRKGT